jgi:hypothetical protein
VDFQEREVSLTGLVLCLRVTLENGLDLKFTDHRRKLAVSAAKRDFYQCLARKM